MRRTEGVRLAGEEPQRFPVKGEWCGSTKASVVVEDVKLAKRQQLAMQVARICVVMIRN